MQKLRMEVLEKMMRSNLSRGEVDVLLYIARFQDISGVARGIYYKDVCEATGLSFQGFYNCRQALVEKGIIEIQKQHSHDVDIRIKGNSFVAYDYDDKFQKGYINLNKNMIRSEKFLHLKANAKLMLLWLMREWQIFHSKSLRNSYQILKENLIGKFQGLLGVSGRMVRRYLGLLTPFLSFHLEGGRKFFITFKSGSLQKPTVSENDELRIHQVGAACRRLRIDAGEKEFAETVQVLSQHTPELKMDTQFNLTHILEDTLQVINQNIKNKYKWKRYLNPALIHKVLIEYLTPDNLMPESIAI